MPIQHLSPLRSGLRPFTSLTMSIFEANPYRHHDEELRQRLDGNDHRPGSADTVVMTLIANSEAGMKNREDLLLMSSVPCGSPAPSPASAARGLTNLPKREEQRRWDNRKRGELGGSGVIQCG